MLLKRNKMRKTFIIILLLGWQMLSYAQSVSPTATYNDENGDEQTLEPGGTCTGSAPLTVHFYANVENTEGYSEHFEWRFYTDSNTDEPELVRYDADTEYTFNKAGAHRVALFATFSLGTDTIAYTMEDYPAFVISVSESKLDFPNAFSPNGDGINDIYKAKDGYQSIVEFQATIFNRWGQKLYSWTDPAGGWDGTFNGKAVADGVYFVNVKAKGADGRVYHIRRDVNLLRGYTENTTVNE